MTRATPNDRLIPWLLSCLRDVPRENITLLNSLGTHRPNTRAELEQMLTPAVVQNYRVVNHEAKNPSALVPLGTTRDGTPALLNRLFVGGGRTHCHRLHRTAFLRRLQRRSQRHHAGRRRPSDGNREHQSQCPA